MTVVAYDKQALLKAVAKFNRRYFNHFTLGFAGRPHSPYVILRHVGRTSGRTYATPVVAVPTAEGFVIPMPYGEGTDWLRNVLTAGEAVIAAQGHAYRIVQPEVVEPEQALEAFGPRSAAVLRCLGVEDYLRVRRDPDGPLGGTEYEALIAPYPPTLALQVLGGALGLVMVLVLLRRWFGRRS